MAITLIKADGTGLSTANCYADLTDFAEYAELIGETVTAYTDEQIKSALYVAANKYIDRLHNFKGKPIDDGQSMKLYTELVTFDDASKDIIMANIEAAILHLKGFLFVDETTQDSNGTVIAESSELDVLKKSVEYREGSEIRTKYNTSTIDKLLAKYTVFSSGGIAVVNV